MSSNIFSHALKSVKQNVQKQQPSQKSGSNKQHANDSNQSKQNLSILDRIKKKNNGSWKNNFDNSDDEENNKRLLGGVQKRIIKKGEKDIQLNVKKVLTLKRSSGDDNETNLNLKINKNNNNIQNEWKHDKFKGVPSASCNYTVFLRNIPPKLTIFNVKRCLSDSDQNLITGIRVQKNTAEVNFSRLDAAHRAVQDLHGQIIKNCQIKASLVSEVNKPVSISNRVLKKNEKSNSFEQEDDEQENFDDDDEQNSKNNEDSNDGSKNDEEDEEEEEEEKQVNVSQKMQIDQPSNQTSIFSRIKKKN